MTVYYDNDEDEVIANNAVEYAYFDEDGRLHIDIEQIMMGRAERKIKEWIDAFQGAIMWRIK